MEVSTEKIDGTEQNTAAFDPSELPTLVKALRFARDYFNPPEDSTSLTQPKDSLPNKNKEASQICADLADKAADHPKGSGRLILRGIAAHLACIAIAVDGSRDRASDESKTLLATYDSVMKDANAEREAMRGAKGAADPKTKAALKTRGNPYS